ncbi:MAG: enoyl-CoA hydratase-related protein, partial [Bdellovibrionota bacterium]
MKPKHLKLSYENDGKLFRVRINRPEVRNAFNQELIEDYSQVFSALAAAEHKDLTRVRAVLLQGEGPAFCGGGDLNWMKRSLTLSHEEN